MPQEPESLLQQYIRQSDIILRQCDGQMVNENGTIGTFRKTTRNILCAYINYLLIDHLKEISGNKTADFSNLLGMW